MRHSTFMSLAAFVTAAAIAGCTGTPWQRPALPSQSDATARGLAALQKLQIRDGGFSQPDTPGHVGISSLAGLAFLATGSTNASGPYAENIARVTRYVAGSQRPDGVLGNPGDAGPMYGHGFALLFLSQVYTTGDAATKNTLRPVLQKAVALTEKAQNRDGGWRYSPSPADADVSVSAGQLKALRAAQEAGIKIDPRVIERAVAYIRSCQSPDGGFVYIRGQGAPGWARSAAAVATLLYTGVRDDRATQAGLQYLAKTSKDPHQEFVYYGNYYLAQVLNVSGAPRGLAYADLQRSVLEKQDAKSGLWHGEAGDAYATATALLVLEMPQSKLPAFRMR